MDRAIQILLVEDDRATRVLLRDFLDGAEGLEVCGEGYDGWQGLELTEEHKPDLVLLDLVMPGLDGFGFLRALREIPEGRRPKVIVLSAVGADEYIQKAFSLGASYYMVKPIRLEDLSARIDELFPAAKDSVRGLGAWNLIRLGANRGCLGFRFACYGLELLRREERMPQMKEIYLRIAGKYATSYSCVEKDLRTMVRQIHTAGTEYYRETLGFRGDKPPDNGTFLRRLAEEMAKGAR